MKKARAETLPKMGRAKRKCCTTWVKKFARLSSQVRVAGKTPKRTTRKKK